MRHLSFSHARPAATIIAALPQLLLSGAAWGQSAPATSAQPSPPANQSANQRASQPAADAAESTSRAPWDAQYPDWTLRIEPAVWYASAEADVKMPGAAGSTQNEFSLNDFNLDEPEWTPMGFVHLQLGKWRISAGGFAFSSDDQESVVGNSGQLGSLSLASGDRTRSSLDFWSAELQVAYRLIHKPLGTTQGGDPRLVFGLEPVLGVRVYDADLDVRALSGASSGQSTSGDDFFFEPTAGIRLEGEFVKQFTLDVQTGFGVGPWGDTDSFSWDITVGGTWRPIPNLGVRIGYRHLLFNLESGSGADTFQLDGSIAGLFAGLEIRF